MVCYINKYTLYIFLYICYRQFDVIRHLGVRWSLRGKDNIQFKIYIKSYILLICFVTNLLFWDKNKNRFFKKDFQAQKIFFFYIKRSCCYYTVSIYSCGTKLLIFSDYMRLCYITSVFLPNQRRPKILFRAQLRRKYLISWFDAQRLESIFGSVQTLATIWSYNEFLDKTWNIGLFWYKIFGMSFCDIFFRNEIIMKIFNS